MAIIQKVLQGWSKILLDDTQMVIKGDADISQTNFWQGAELKESLYKMIIKKLILDIFYSTKYYIY